ncbi:MAG: M16 family metallopeptidase [Legionellales bacterium]
MKTVTTTLMLFLSLHVFANTFKTEKWVTNNGVQVIFFQAMEVPMLDISLAFAAGSAYDGSQYGLSALTGQMMNQGNAGKDATTVAEALADTGAQFNAENSKDMIVFSLRTLTDHQALEQSKTTFSQIINHPDFPDDAFNHEKKQLLMAIEQAKDSPEEIANLNFFKVLYQQHPYAHPLNGTTASMSALKKSDVIQFYKHYYVGANAFLVIAGAIDHHQAHQIAEQLTHELPQGTPATPVPKAKPLTHAEKINIKFPSSQTIIRLGQMGIDHQNPDYFPLVVGNYILGGGSLGSQLGVEVREKRGLTYGIDSQFVPMLGKGPFLISLSSKNDQATTALKIIDETLQKFINNGPSQHELAAAKRYLTGSFPLSLASNRSITGLLLRIAFYHLPDNYLDTYVAHINAVTNEEIKQAFKRQINPNNLLLITVGQS